MNPPSHARAPINDNTECRQHFHRTAPSRVNMGWLHDMTGMKDWGFGHQELMVIVYKKDPNGKNSFARSLGTPTL